jgi:hypothetical protein
MNQLGKIIHRFQESIEREITHSDGDEDHFSPTDGAT